jgi:hypothetical protein
VETFILLRHADTPIRPYAHTPIRPYAHTFPRPRSFQPENADRRQKIDRPLENHVFDMLPLGSSVGMIRFVCIEIGVFTSDQGGFVGMWAFFVKNVICYAILICERKDCVLLRLWK